jgi:N-acetylmuramoyl-L-alanine amidase
MPTSTPLTGTDVLRLAKKHIGERYVLGIVTPKDNRAWSGPWDCAEFASWLTYQVSGKIYGCNDDAAPPAIADAYTGSWARDASTLGVRVSVNEAASTPGAFVLRVPEGGPTGHIVVSDGKGGTVEAHSTKRGVIESSLDKRRWDMGILVPGIAFTQNAQPVSVVPPGSVIYRLMSPPQTHPMVKKIQRSLKRAGFDPGGVDGVFGAQTQAAVVAFQLSKGLVPDGEVGPKTAKALNIDLPDA